MTAVLNWIKSNVFIVVFVVVMIAALVGFPLVASRMNAVIRADMRIRADRNGKLDRLETTIELGAVTKKILPNPRLLEEYRQLAQKKKTDAEEVRAFAKKINQDGHVRLEPDLFPAPRQDQREVLPETFHRKLVAAYANLLKEIGAGEPPPIEETVAHLEAVESQFRINDLKKGETENLTPEETERLHEELGKKRMARYGDAAQKFRIYCTESSLNVPSWLPGNLPRLRDLFEWQWQFWIHQDILHALNKANSSAPNVVQAPAKRIVSIRPVDAASVVTSPAGSGEGSSLGAGDGSGGSQPGKRRLRGSQPPGAAQPGDGADGASTGAGNDTGTPSDVAAGGTIVIDPAVEAPLDYGVTFTGRKTNPLYDVRLIELRLVVRTESLPVVIDALAAQNFITVLDLDLSPIDPYEAIKEGYFYGDDSCSQVTLLLETIWLREWTAEWMPQDLRDELGIKTQPRAVAAASTIR